MPGWGVSPWDWRLIDKDTFRLTGLPLAYSLANSSFAVFNSNTVNDKSLLRRYPLAAVRPSAHPRNDKK
jgi:hypothetical protein